MSEDDLLAIVRKAAVGGPGEGVELGIGDDAALLRQTPGRELVACVDTLNLGTHFLADQPAESVGHRALAVNLSDLAAMGADPRFALLSLSLPRDDGPWLTRFMAGFSALARRHGVALVGGDTTRGPLSVAVTVLGEVPPDSALRRGRARAGDEIWVSGVLGGAAAALADASVAQERLLYPQPRLALGCALRGVATSALDLSDGLRVDLGRLLTPLGALVDAAALPVDPAAAAAGGGWRLAVCGGDDYELCFTAPRSAREAVRSAAAAAGVPVTRIGTVTAAGPCRVLVDGDEVPLSTLEGFEHFPCDA